MAKYFFAGFGLPARTSFAGGFSDDGACKCQAHAVLSATAVLALAAAAAGAALALLRRHGG